MLKVNLVKKISCLFFFSVHDAFHFLTIACRYVSLLFLHLRFFFFHLQALELARSVQSQRDLGCQASQVVHLEEGLNCDDRLAEDFWRLLGGRRPYRGELVFFFFGLKCDLVTR